MTQRTIIPPGRPHGTGLVIYTCHACKRTLSADAARLVHIDGRLVAVHQHEEPNGSRPTPQ
jgi:hypothetical protein